MNKKKAAAVISAAGLASVLAVGGTLAYLTNTQSATNTFTVGNVEVGIDEPNFPGKGGDGNNDGIEDSKKSTDTDNDGIPDINEDQVPQQETDKDPMVTNKSTSDAIVFVKVTVPVRKITAIADDGTAATEATLSELYTFKQGQMATQDNPLGQDYVFNYTAPDGSASTTIKNDSVTSHENHWNENWTELTEYEEGAPTDGVYADGTTYRTYVFGYNTRLHGLKSISEGTWKGTTASNSVGETTVPLFQKVQLKNFASAEISDTEIENITVQTYVIQADNVVSGNGVISTDATISKDDLSAIYKTYVTQDANLVKSNDAAAAENAGSGKTAVSQNAALKTK